MQIKIKVKKGYEPEDVLVKALKTIRAEREQGKLDDPYLRYLQEYSLNLYDTVMAQMEKEIAAVLTNQPLKKSIGTVRLKVPYDKLNQELLRKSTKGKVLTAVTVNAKTGQYQSHRWKNPNQAFDIALSDIKKQVGNIEDIKFIDKKTNKESSEEEILNNYAKQDSKVTLQNFIKEKYLINNKTKKETPKVIVKNDKTEYQLKEMRAVYLDDEILNHYQEKTDRFISTLDELERETLTEYMTEGAYDINKRLGQGNIRPNDYRIGMLDKVTTSMKLDHDIVVYRGTRKSFFNNVEEDDIITIPTYQSTSIDEDRAIDFSTNHQDDDRIVLEINLPKGTECFYVGRQEEGWDEKEFILPRDLEFQVLWKDESEEVTKLELQVVEKQKVIVKDDEIKYNKAKYESFYNEPIDLNEYRERTVKPDEVIKHLQGSKDIYEREIDKTNVRDITLEFIKALGIEKPFIAVRPLSAHGACIIHPFGETLTIGDMIFNSEDSRDKEYKLKTVFHESAHKLSNGAKLSDNDKHRPPERKYTKVDESLTECIALYLAKQVYPNMEYGLSYGEYLFDVLQFIKDIEGFQDCTTISDVGKVAFEKRLSGEIVDIDKFYKARAKHMRTREEGFTHEFYKKHLNYIEENAKEISKLVAKGLNAEEYAHIMQLDIYDAVTKDIKKLEGNGKLVMGMALTISMERNGIGFDKKPEEPKAPEEPKEIKIDKEELEKVEELLKPLKYGSGMNVKGKKKAAENLLIDTSQRVNTALQNKGIDNDAEISMEMNALLAALNSGSITISQAMNDPRFASAAYLFIKAILEDDDELDQAIIDVLGGLQWYTFQQKYTKTKT